MDSLVSEIVDHPRKFWGGVVVVAATTGVATFAIFHPWGTSSGGPHTSPTASKQEHSVHPPGSGPTRVPRVEPTHDVPHVGRKTHIPSIRRTPRSTHSTRSSPTSISPIPIPSISVTSPSSNSPSTSPTETPETPETPAEGG